MEKWNSDEGSPRVMGGDGSPYFLYMHPHCIRNELFTLAYPIRHHREKLVLLGRNSWLQYSTIGASDVRCIHVSWDFYLIPEAWWNMFSCMDCEYL